MEMSTDPKVTELWDSDADYDLAGIGLARVYCVFLTYDQFVFALFFNFQCFSHLFCVVSTTAIDCTGKTCLRNDLLCVEWDVKLYSLTALVVKYWSESMKLLNITQTKMTRRTRWVAIWDQFLGSNYKKHLTIILGYDNDLRYVVRQTYDKVKMS